MPMCPWSDGIHPVQQPGTVGGSNGDVVRVVLHITDAKIIEGRHQAPINAAWWDKSTKDARANGKLNFGVSAHFTVEADGFVYQHVDTDKVAKGTGWLTAGSVHIEHSGKSPDPMTEIQLHWAAYLIAWLASVHPKIKLEATGTSESDYGDPTRPGITCHRFIQLAYVKLFPSKAITPKPCPGAGIIRQIPELVRLAKVYKQNANFNV